MTALNTVMLSVVYAECRKKAHYAECCYAECCYAECCYAECCYAECRYAVYHYAECHSTLKSHQARYDFYQGTLTKWEDLLQLTSLP